MGRSLHTTTETARIGVAHCGNRCPDKNLNKKGCRDKASKTEALDLCQRRQY